MIDRKWAALKLGLYLLRHPRAWGYEVLLCADTVLPPSPWTAEFRAEVDHKWRVVRLSGDLT
jgi:hypothetical protein